MTSEIDKGSQLPGNHY